MTLVAALTPAGARADRALVIRVEAWDENCSLHIPMLLEADELRQQLAQRDARIADLEREVAVLTQQLATRDICGDDLWSD